MWRGTEEHDTLAQRAVVALHSECTACHGAVHLKMVSVTLCGFFTLVKNKNGAALGALGRERSWASGRL